MYVPRGRKRAQFGHGWFKLLCCHNSVCEKRRRRSLSHAVAGSLLGDPGGAAQFGQRLPLLRPRLAAVEWRERWRWRGQWPFRSCAMDPCCYRALGMSCLRPRAFFLTCICFLTPVCASPFLRFLPSPAYSSLSRELSVLYRCFFLWRLHYCPQPDQF